MVLENLPQWESIHGHICDPRISSFISLCIDSSWSLVKGLFGGHALAWLCFSSVMSPLLLSVTFNLSSFTPSFCSIPLLLSIIPFTPHQSYLQLCGCLVILRSGGIPLRVPSIRALLNWACLTRLWSLTHRGDQITFTAWEYAYSHMHVHDAWCSAGHFSQE